MSIRLLSATDMEKALTMEAAVEAAAAAFAALSAGRADTPQRLALHTPGGVSLFMPAFLQDSGALTVKVVSVYSQNPTQGLATIQALVLALDSRTGRPLGILEGRRLTARRTGAAAGLATRLLARPQAQGAGPFGGRGHGLGSGPGGSGRTALKRYPRL